MKRLLLLCIGALFAFAGPAKADPVQLRFGVIANSMHSFQAVVFDVAQSQGFFDREGLNIQFVPLAGVDHMITALDDKSVDISSTAMPYLIKGALRGSDAVAVVGGPANTIYSLVAKPDIKSFANLKGKTIGLSLPMDVISIGARMLLEKHGLGASDFKVKQLIGTPVRAKCLESGDCAATPLSQPDDVELETKGFHVLGTSHEVIPDMQFTVIAARRSWADRHQDALVRFARAMGDAYAFMRDPANRDAVIAMAMKRTKASKQVIARIYDLYYRPDLGVMPRHAEINMKGIAEVIALLGSAGDLKAPLPKPERFVDLRFLQAAHMQ